MQLVDCHDFRAAAKEQSKWLTLHMLAAKTCTWRPLRGYIFRVAALYGSRLLLRKTRRHVDPNMNVPLEHCFRL